MAQRNAIVLFVSVAALLAIGLIMLTSTTIWGVGSDGTYGEVVKQSIWAVVGFAVATGIAMMDYRILRRFVLPIYGVSIILLVLCYVPGIGRTINGASRWIVLPGIGQLQPSEAAKIALIVGLSAWYAHYQAETRKFLKGFVAPGAILALPIVLIFFEKDMGTAAGLGAAGIFVMYVAGTRKRFLIPAVVSAAVGFVILVMANENRMKRIFAFLDLEGTRLAEGLQQYRALLAFGNGGMSGTGLGNGSEKHGYMPFAHTDFIFPMIGEELGLWFTLGVVFCFVLIAVYGISISVSAPDVFGRLMAMGLTCSIVIPAMMNIGVTTAVLPNTGLPLPFVSYGGSNLVLTMAAVGMLISIHRHSSGKEAVKLNVLDRQTEIRI